MEQGLNLFLQPKEDVALLPIEDKRLLTADKSDLSEMASLIIEGVDDGKADPLDTLIMAKKGLYVFEAIAEAMKNKVPNPGKGYAKHNCEVSERATGVSYSFDTCNDPIWLELNTEFISVKAKLKDREKWLKTFTKPTEVEDQANEDGEVIMEARTINPPVKMAGISTIISIK
jgi:hypothetical protein